MTGVTHRSVSSVFCSASPSCTGAPPPAPRHRPRCGSGPDAGGNAVTDGNTGSGRRPGRPGRVHLHGCVPSSARPTRLWHRRRCLAQVGKHIQTVLARRGLIGKRTQESQVISSEQHAFLLPREICKLETFSTLTRMAAEKGCTTREEKHMEGQIAFFTILWSPHSHVWKNDKNMKKISVRV